MSKSTLYESDNNIQELYKSLTHENISLLKSLVYGGFNAYNKFVQKYKKNLYLDTRYQDEICTYLDKIMLNVIKNKIPFLGKRILREHQIIKALISGDMVYLASIIASAGRSAVSFIPKFKHYLASYYLYINNLEDYNTKDKQLQLTFNF